LRSDEYVGAAEQLVEVAVATRELFELVEGEHASSPR
jgi:hypothetical protein